MLNLTDKKSPNLSLGEETIVAYTSKEQFQKTVKLLLCCEGRPVEDKLK